MKLDNVVIENFRSVKHAKLKFQPSCRTLVGINEAGKTNILKALSLIDPETAIDPDDVRLPSPDESIDLKSEIEFIFKFDSADHIAIEKLVQSRIASVNHEEAIISRLNIKMNIRGVISKVEFAPHNIRVSDAIRRNQYYRFPGKDILINKWYKPSQLVPADLKILEGPLKGAIIKNYALISEEASKHFPQEHLKEAVIEDLHQCIGAQICHYVGTRLPRAIYWAHTEDNLIPASIDTDLFRADPDICKPLRNAFLLAGIEDVDEEIEKVSKRSNGVRNLLDRVAKKATEHISNIWPEYDHIQIDFRQNGKFLETSIKDKYNLFDFSRRSDGFKRFLSFLLTLSIPSETDELSDVVILIDDPDVGLHPSGTRYIRDELIKISKKNYIVMSTHSIFMIDKEDISRHIIVKKDDETTSISNVDESNVLDEEVLYNALGFSFLEILKEDNVVFEGWRDKKLFSVAVSGPLSKSNKLFKKFGVCHLKGVKDAKNIVPIIQLARRRCLVVSDSDNAAKEKKREHEAGRMYGKWRTYSELVTSEHIHTAEDFIKMQSFNDCVRALIHPSLASLDLGEFSLNGESNKLKQFVDWLTTKGIAKEAKGAIEIELKTAIFDTLSKSQIRSVINEAITSIIREMAND